MTATEGKQKCIVCAAPATHYDRGTFTFTNMRGDERTVHGIKRGYCDRHKPSGAKPISDDGIQPR